MITDWLMVGITSVYVVATIVICIANLNSARATQNQLAEMKREHDENVRLGIMPYFEVNCSDFDANKQKFPFTHYSFTGPYEDATYRVSFTNLQLKNVGMNLATSIYAELEYEDMRKQCKLTGLTVHPGGEEKLVFYSLIPRDTVYAYKHSYEFSRKEAKIILKYDDIRGNHYSQAAKVSFEVRDCDDKTPIDVMMPWRRGEVHKECTIYVNSCFTFPPVFLEKTVEV